MPKPNLGITSCIETERAIVCLLAIVYCSFVRDCLLFAIVYLIVVLELQLNFLQMVFSYYSSTCIVELNVSLFVIEGLNVYLKHVPVYLPLSV